MEKLVSDLGIQAVHALLSLTMTNGPEDQGTLAVQRFTVQAKLHADVHRKVKICI